MLSLERSGSFCSSATTIVGFEGSTTGDGDFAFFNVATDWMRGRTEMCAHTRERERERAR
jgi:hypothetical protein